MDIYIHRSLGQIDRASNHDPLLKLEKNIINSVNNLKEEIVNVKDIVIKRLQDENEKLPAKCSTLENKVLSLEQNLNLLGQYGRRNNLVLSGILENIPDNQFNHLQNTVRHSSEYAVRRNRGLPLIWTKDRIQKNYCFVNRKHCKKDPP